MATRSWSGRVAVVTGAGSGIGRALARALDARGCTLVLSDIDGDRAAETAAACRDATGMVLDVRDRAAVRDHADRVAADHGGVHLLVNNAGVGLDADALEQSGEDLDWVLDTNLHGVLHGSQAFLPHLVATGAAGPFDTHLVNVSSLLGLIPMPTQSAYCAAKYGVRGYTESVAAEMRLRGHPVQVHCVHPGGIKTNIANWARVRGGRDAAAQAEFFNTQVARLSPEAAATTILRGVERGRRRILVGDDARIVNVVAAVAGSRMQTLVRHFAARAPDHADPHVGHDVQHGGDHGGQPGGHAGQSGGGHDGQHGVDHEDRTRA